MATDMHTRLSLLLVDVQTHSGRARNGAAPERLKVAIGEKFGEEAALAAKVDLGLEKE